MDRLPEEVIQHIITFLSVEEAAQSSFLSKTWLRAWSTYPYLIFRQHIIGRKLAGEKSYSEEGQEKFAKFVHDNLLRYSSHNLPINKFYLQSTSFDRELASLLDKWLGMVVNMGVKHLDLHLTPSTTLASASYSLPQIIFATNQLTSLMVQGSRTFFTLENPLSFSSSIIKCCNLKTLCLRLVYLDERIFQILCSSCPLIEQLSLKILGLKNIQVRNLRKLVVLDVTTTRDQILLIAETPHLENLLLWESHCFTITIFGSQALKLLYLSDSTVTVVPLHNLISQCPLLEALHLRNCDALEWVHLSSQTLKRMTIYECAALVEVKIDAPNLLFLRYFAVSNQIPSFSFKSLSEKFNSNLEIRPSYNLDNSFFVKIKDLLTQLNCCEFHLHVYSKKICFNIDDLTEISLLPQTKIRRLRMGTITSPPLTYSTLVHGLLWSCHPEALEVCCHSEMGYEEFIRFLCKQLLDRRSPNCCSSDQVLCWRHYLNHVEVEYLERIVGRKELMWQPFDWKSLVDGSMISEKYSVIRFTLNWIL